MNKVARELIYKSEVKKRTFDVLKITTLSKKKNAWQKVRIVDDNKIEFIEQFKVLF